MFARALYGLRDGSRDSSGRALAFRGLRALKFAASLRRTFPFFRLFGDRRRRCNTGTGSAALKSPDYYIRAALNAALRRTVLCRAVLCRMRGRIRACMYVNPMALTSFPPRAPLPWFLLNVRANKEPIPAGREWPYRMDSHINTKMRVRYLRR